MLRESLSRVFPEDLSVRFRLPARAVLYDSMPGHARAWMEMCRREGLHAEYDEFFGYEGRTGASTISLPRLMLPAASILSVCRRAKRERRTPRRNTF